MARRGWSTSNYLEYAAAILTTTPITMACWGRTDTLGVAQTMLGIYNGAASNNYLRLTISAGNRIQAGVFDGTTNAVATGPVATVSANTWFQAGAVFASSTSRTAYFNGVAGTANTTSSAPSSQTRTSIGLARTSAPGLPFGAGGNGDLAWAAIWNIALATVDMAALAAGADPRLIHPEALVGYWPILGLNSPENNLVSNTSVMTLTGSLSRVDSPPIFQAG